MLHSRSVVAARGVAPGPATVSRRGCGLSPWQRSRLTAPGAGARGQFRPIRGAQGWGPLAAPPSTPCLCGGQQGGICSGFHNCRDFNEQRTSCAGVSWRHWQRCCERVLRCLLYMWLRFCSFSSSSPPPPSPAVLNMF